MRTKSPSDNTYTNHLHTDSQLRKPLLMVYAETVVSASWCRAFNKAISLSQFYQLQRKVLVKLTQKPSAFSEYLQKALEPKEIEMRGNYTHHSCKPLQREHNRSLSALSVSLLPARHAPAVPLWHTAFPEILSRTARQGHLYNTH